MKLANSFGMVLARFFMSAIFLASGMNKILHWQYQESEIYRILSEWQSYTYFSDPLREFFSSVIPWSPILLIVGTFFEFVGGLMVLMGFKERLGAGLLILFLIPTTMIVHQFWFIEGVQREIAITHFLKNLAILGGLFMIFLNGAPGTSSQRSPTPLNFG